MLEVTVHDESVGGEDDGLGPVPGEYSLYSLATIDLLCCHLTFDLLMAPLKLWSVLWR